MKQEWEAMRLGDVATIERRTIRPEQASGLELLVGMENITSEGTFVGVSTVNSTEIKSNKFLFSDHHVLYGRLGPHQSKIAAPGFSGICSTDVLPIRPHTGLDRKFLFHFLRLPHNVAAAANSAVGTSHRRMRPTVLESLQIPLPPMEEQRRIAGVLDEAEALRAKRRQALLKLDELTQSIFHDMFGDGSGWPHYTLSTVAVIERKAVKPAEITGKEYYVGLEHVSSDGEFLAVETAGKAGLRSNKFAFTEDHVLYGKLRPYLSKIAAPDFAGICSTDILPIRPGDRLDRRYLLHYLRTPAMLAHATNCAVGINLPRLSPKMLESFTVAMPPLVEQTRFGGVIDAVEAMRTMHRDGLTALDTLFASLQQRAFRGEL